MPKLTLSMIVKNEEDYLPGCLESVQNIADEIVIVDTGSNDKTIEIAEQFNANVFHFNWVNDFSAARNFALSKSNGDWVLYLDADERLVAKSKKELLNNIKKSNKTGVKCLVKSKNSYQNNSQMMKYVRLFRNSSNIEFRGKAHEQIEPSILENQYKILDSSIEIIHLGYDVPDVELKIKAKRNLDLMLAEYSEKPTSYLAFQIGNSYSILNQNDVSLKYFREVLKDSEISRELHSVCYFNLADYEMRKGNLEEAKKLIDKGIKVDKNHTLLNMLASQIYKNLNWQSSSLDYCKKALELNRKSKLKSGNDNVMDIHIDDAKIIKEGILTSLQFESQNELNYFLGKMKEVNNDYHKIVISILTNSLSNDTDFDNLISFTNEDNLDFVFTLLKYNSNNESKLDFFSKLYDKFNNDTSYLTNFGVFLLSINQLEQSKIFLESAIQNADYNDSVIFYLISIYTSTNEKEKITALLNEAELRAANNSTLKTKLIILKKKLQPIINPE